MLDSLSEFCGNINLTGIAILDYLPLTDIDLSSYRFSGNATMATDVALKAGKKWLNVPLLSSAEGEQFYDESQNNDGTTTVSITSIFPVNTAQVRKTLSDMQIAQKFILRLTDRNGAKFMLGSFPYPLLFSASFQSSRSAFTLKFSGKQPRFILGYNF